MQMSGRVYNISALLSSPEHSYIPAVTHDRKRMALLSCFVMFHSIFLNAVFKIFNWIIMDCYYQIHQTQKQTAFWIRLETDDLFKIWYVQKSYYITGFLNFQSGFPCSFIFSVQFIQEFENPKQTKHSVVRLIFILQVEMWKVKNNTALINLKEIWCSPKSAFLGVSLMVQFQDYCHSLSQKVF